MTTTPPETTTPVVLVLRHETEVDGVTTSEWRCSCGSSDFRYEESHPSTREQSENTADGLVFFSHFEWYDGDDTPGVVCEGCQAVVTVPEGCAVDFD